MGAIDMNLMTIEVLESLLATTKNDFKRLSIQYIEKGWERKLETFPTTWLAFTRAQIQLQLAEFSHDRYMKYLEAEQRTEERLEFLQSLYIDEMRKAVKRVNEFSNYVTNLRTMII